jgi:hypothetical protein
MFASQLLHEIATDLKVHNLTSENLYGMSSDAPHCSTAYTTCYERASGVVSGDGHVSWHILKKKTESKGK